MVRLTDRYWWLNKRDGLLGLVRTTVAPRSICGKRHPRIPSFTCDRPRGHRGNHADRRGMGQMPKWDVA